MAIKALARLTETAVAVDRSQLKAYVTSLGFRQFKVVRASDDYVLVLVSNIVRLDALNKVLGKPITLTKTKSGVTRRATWKTDGGYVTYREALNTLELTNVPLPTKLTSELVAKYAKTLDHYSANDGESTGPSMSYVVHALWLGSPSPADLYWALAKSNYGSLASQYHKQAGMKMRPEIKDLLVQSAEKARKLLPEVYTDYANKLEPLLARAKSSLRSYLESDAFKQELTMSVDYSKQPDKIPAVLEDAARLTDEDLDRLIDGRELSGTRVYAALTDTMWDICFKNRAAAIGLARLKKSAADKYKTPAFPMGAGLTNLFDLKRYQ